MACCLRVVLNSCGQFNNKYQAASFNVKYGIITNAGNTCLPLMYLLCFNDGYVALFYRAAALCHYFYGCYIALYLK